MARMKIKVSSRTDGRVILNFEDAFNLALKEGDPVLLRNEEGNIVAGVIGISNEINKGTIEVDGNIAENLAKLDGEEVEFSKPVRVVNAEMIVFDIIRHVDPRILQDAAGKGKLKDALINRVLTRTQALSPLEGIWLRPRPGKISPDADIIRIVDSTKIGIVPRAGEAETILLVDRSASMKESKDSSGRPIYFPSKMEVAKKAVKEFIDRKLAAGIIERMGLIGFDDEVNILLPLTEFRKELRDKLHQAVDQLHPRGNTDIAKAIKTAVDLFEQQGNRDKIWAIVLLTDGERTVGGDPIEAAEYAASRNVIIYTVFIGWKKDAMTVLKEIARITHGKDHYATDPNMLEQLYKDFGEKFELPVVSPREYETKIMYPEGSNR
ncbi:MAG: VWA domain-containing protein [Candidatus Bathyarchaeia archaeon]